MNEKKKKVNAKKEIYQGIKFIILSVCADILCRDIYLSHINPKPNHVQLPSFFFYSAIISCILLNIGSICYLIFYSCKYLKEKRLKDKNDNKKVLIIDTEDDYRRW